MVHGVEYVKIQAYDNSGKVRTIEMPKDQISINLSNGSMSVNREGIYTIGRENPNAPKPKTTTTTTTTLVGTEFYNQGRPIDPNLTEALSDIATIANDGTVTLKAGITKEAFTDAIKKYCEQNQISVAPELKLEGDEEWKQHLVDEGAVSIKEPEAETVEYIISDRDKLNQLTTKKEEDSQVESRQKSIKFQFTDTTVTEPDNIEPPKGISTDKKLQKAYAQAIESDIHAWMADPKNANDRDEYMVETLYGKKYDKEYAKLSNEYNSYGAMAKAYMEQFGSPAQKNAFEEFKAKYLKTDELSPEEFAEFNSKIEDLFPEGQLKKHTAADYDLTGKTARQRVAILQNREEALYAMFAAQKGNEEFAPQDVTANFAVKKVLANRTNEQKADDYNKFVKKQVQIQVDAAISEEVYPGRIVAWDGDEADQIKKNLQEGQSVATLSRGDRKMIQKYPDLFCTEITPKAGQQLKKGVDYTFTKEFVDENGNKQIAYMKFESDLYKEFHRKATDSRIDPEKLAEDLYATLSEQRAYGQNTVLSRDDKLNYIKYADVRGNKNGKMGYFKTKSLRKGIRRSGLKAETDYTHIEKLKHACLTALKAAAFAAIPAIGGAALAGKLAVAPEILKAVTDGHYQSYKGQTFKAHVDGETKWVTTTDTETFIVDGEAFSNKYTHNTPVNFDERWIEVTSPDGKVWVDPQTKEVISKGGSDQKYFRTGLYAAAIAGGAAGLADLLTSDVKDEGTRWHGRINLKKKPTTATNTSEANVSYEQKIPVEVRQGEFTKGEKVQTFKNKAWQGPAAYSIMYTYEDGTSVKPSDFAKAYQTKINGPMSKHYFYVFTDLVVNGKKLVPVRDLNAAYARVPEGVRGTTGGVEVAINNNQRTYRGTARIKG